MSEPSAAAPSGEQKSVEHAKYDFFMVVQGYLEQAADAIDLEPYIRTILSQPKNEIIVNFPVRMDDGTVRLFKGYRVQHSNILGPFKGGMRYHHEVTLDDCKALAAMMTWKGALMRLPYGGGKGGVKFDPRSVSKAELQRITRRFFFSLGSNIGPDFDIPAPDVGTNSQMMAWAMDTYANTVGHYDKQAVKGVVTGKPVASGGTLGREKATGQGVVHCITEWAREKNFDLEGATMIVQGFGNVGSHTAVILSKLGVSTVAVGDHSGYMVNPEGFNAHKLQDWVAERGSIAGYPNGKRVSREEFFSTKADIFVPAALENQVGVAEASALDVKLVAEGANGPLNPAGEKILLDRGIEILPDVLANSGGVTVSYYEWAQNKRAESWTLEEVDAKLETAMKLAYADVTQLARQLRLPLRIAAYAVALKRIQAVYRERDIFPLRATASSAKLPEGATIACAPSCVFVRPGSARRAGRTSRALPSCDRLKSLAHHVPGGDSTWRPTRSSPRPSRSSRTCPSSLARCCHAPARTACSRARSGRWPSRCRPSLRGESWARCRASTPASSRRPRRCWRRARSPCWTGCARRSRPRSWT